MGHSSEDGEKPCPILHPFCPPSSPECEEAHYSPAVGVGSGMKAPDCTEPKTAALPGMSVCAGLPERVGHQAGV